MQSTDTAGPAQITQPPLSPASGAQWSCVQGGCLARGTVIVAVEDALRLLTLQPFCKSGCAFAVRRILQDSSIINQRFRTIALATNSKTYIRMVRMNGLTAQIDLLRQSDVRQVERTRLDFISRRGIQLSTL